ncbi:MAG: hypothetical protein FJX68_11340 [Alphaproteobacteria bacterium]|nr:hypothetical protein [Alphaproteobacteria bacterium]
MLRAIPAFVASLLASAVPASAEPLQVELGKAFMLRLKEDPAVVVVGNPGIADVVVERAKTLFVMGLEAGETNLHILDAEGKALVQTAVVVVPHLLRHVSVLRGVEEATVSCNPRCVGVRNVVGQGAVVPSNLPPTPPNQGITVSGLPPSILGAPPAQAPGSPAPTPGSQAAQPPATGGGGQSVPAPTR